jgi:putative DNA primase/helicase
MPLPDLMNRLGLAEHAKKNTWCPFHENDGQPHKQKSFSVFQKGELWFWKCHAGCGGGDEVDFLAQHFGLSKSNAIRKYAEIAGVNGRSATHSTAATPSEQEPAPKPECDLTEAWKACVGRFSDTHAEQLATWRGYSPEFVRWLREREFVGHNNGNIALPVCNAAGLVVGIHYRVEPKEKTGKATWFYTKGCHVHPLVIGTPKTAAVVLCFESQWDAFAVMDKLGWHNSEAEVSGAEAIIITRGAENGKLAAGLCAADSTLYAFRQNDKTDKNGRNPAEKWLRDVAERAGCKVMLVTTPSQHKDLNTWTLAGATREQIADAIGSSAIVAPRTEHEPSQPESQGAAALQIGTQRDPFELAAEGHPLARTDAGLAERFAFYFKKEAVFQNDTGVWFIWDSKRYRPDPHLVEMRGLMLKTARYTREECSVLPSSVPDDAQSRHFKFALLCEKKERIEAAIKLAASMGMAQPLVAFDRNPWLFNVANGTLDLQTGKLRPHLPEDLLTRLSPIHFLSELHDDIFYHFIQHVTGSDGDLAGYLQRAAGYTLTGHISEKCLFIIFSQLTDTGKSTFVEGMLAAMGDYGLTLDFEVFLETEHKGVNPRYDLAKLRGVRLAVAAETKHGRRFSAETIKRLTGGDTIRAREIRESSVEFRPTHKLWLCTNHAPALEDGGDEATWNRLRRVPFNNQIPREQRDPRIKAALENPESQTCAALLAWMVTGCLAWQRSGLGAAQAVKDSTAKYREETDPLAEFIEDRCVLSSNAECSTRALHKEYEEWCKENGEYPLGKRRFAECLRRYNCQSGKTTGGQRVWRGIGLVATGVSGVSGNSGIDLGINASGESSKEGVPQNVTCDATHATENATGMTANGEERTDSNNGPEDVSLP